MKSRKTVVFWVVNIQLFLVLMAIIIFAPSVANSIGVSVVLAMVGNGATYIGGNVLHAYQKSRFYRVELDENIKNS